MPKEKYAVELTKEEIRNLLNITHKGNAHSAIITKVGKCTCQQTNVYFHMPLSLCLCLYYLHNYSIYQYFTTNTCYQVQCRAKAFALQSLLQR